MALYEVTYSTKTVSNDELSYYDYYVDSIGDNPYEPRSKGRIAKKRAKDYKGIVSAINALISKRNQGP
jgi:hypothetical protein